MKALKLSGDDYFALEFEEFCKGLTCKEIIENLDHRLEIFFEKYDEYDPDNNEIEIINLNTDIETFELLQDFFGDYDIMKSSNIYPETYIFK